MGGAMSEHADHLGTQGLQFFGKVSASISHELKNVLAVLNENAGLMEDLSFAAERGKAIAPEQLQRISGNFSRQIRRADAILKVMNRFAHSVDHSRARIDLTELTTLVATLAGRLAAMRNITLDVIPPAEDITWETNPFLLENLIWLSLEKVMACSEGGGAVRFRLAKEAGEVVLSITAPIQLPADLVTNLPAGQVQLLSALAARLVLGPTGSELEIRLGCRESPAVGEEATGGEGKKG